MKKLALLPILFLTACANTTPITPIGPDTYRISHSTGKYGTVKGIRNGITAIATKKCTDEHSPFQKIREEITPENTLTYTLTFACKTGLQQSNYNGSEANNISASIPTPSTQPKFGELPPSNTVLNQ